MKAFRALVARVAPLGVVLVALVGGAAGRWGG
jgi:hypothetical protein